MAEYPWFGTWNSYTPIQQGVIIPDFSFPDLTLMPAYKEGKYNPPIKLEYIKFDAIVLSQSCDLDGKEVGTIHVCPVDSLEAIFNQNKLNYQHKNAREKEFERLTKGHYVNRYISDKLTAYYIKKLRALKKESMFSGSFTKFKGDRVVTDFSEAIVVSSGYLKKYIKSRTEYLMLNPPYREAMAQKYGLYFMRVGNPKNHRSIKEREYRISPPTIN